MNYASSKATDLDTPRSCVSEMVRDSMWNMDLKGKCVYIKYPKMCTGSSSDDASQKAPLRGEGSLGRNSLAGEDTYLMW